MLSPFALAAISAAQLGLGTFFVLRKSSDVLAAKEETERYRTLSETDDLTGLPNRRCYLRMLRDHYPLEKRVCVIVWNVDGLAELNRSFGHEEGDRLLRRFGTALKTLESVNVRVFRISGDEFALITEGGDDALLKNLLDRLELHLYKETVASPVQLRASHAAASGHGWELARLVSEAEAAIYNSK